LHRFKNLIVAFFFIGFVGEMAMACPGSLRAFNKKLDGKNSCILEETIVGQLTLTSGFNYVVLGPVFIGSEILVCKSTHLTLQKTKVDFGMA